MHDTIRWASFMFYTVGALGGVIYLIELFYDWMRAKHVKNHVNYDDPVENIVQLHPQQASKEAPISARRG